MRRDELGRVAGRRSRREWLSTLERYAFPVLGPLPVSSIDAVLVHRVLEPIWSTKPHVGQRLRERIEARPGLRERHEACATGENPRSLAGQPRTHAAQGQQDEP